MNTCHDTADRPGTTGGVLTVALAGNPNSGKTTIFNALTGLRQKVANYPGVTVEKKTGRCRLEDGSKINIIDLPGTYSLISRSPDEVVAMEVLRGLRKDTPAPDAVIVVVDASNLQRNLYLVSQMIELGRPMVIALNMMDIARRRGINISAERLENQLGVPVVEVVGNKHQGITPLKEAIGKARVAEMPEWPLPEGMKVEVGRLAGELGEAGMQRSTLNTQHSTLNAKAGASGLDVARIGNSGEVGEAGMQRSTLNTQRSTLNAKAGASGLDVARIGNSGEVGEAGMQRSTLNTQRSTLNAKAGASGLDVARIGNSGEVGEAGMQRSTLNTQHSTLNEDLPPSDLKVERCVLSVERCMNLITAERLLIGDCASDLSVLASRDPIKSQLAAAHDRLSRLGIDPMQADIEAHYQWIDEIAAGALVPACAAIDEMTRGTSLAPIVAPGPIVVAAPKAHFSEKLDRILIHKVWGLIIFAVVMATLFISIFWLAQPIMDWMTAAITWLGDVSTRHLGDGALKDLINQGIFQGVGTVLVFLPQIALLFFFLAILEDSGYLARAAFLMDRLLSKVGLHGKSFIPLLSSFACAIPGIMATRTIENRKDRLATILVAPFMSCSARLPVYTLLIGTFFVVPGFKGTLLKAGIMLACYSLGIVAAVVTALFFKRSFLKGMPSSFILEMPTYKMPQISIVARQVWSNASQFVKKAGTTIFALSVILWALAYYPRLPAERGEQIRQSTLPDAAANVFSSHGHEIGLAMPLKATKEEWHNWGQQIIPSLSPDEQKEADEAADNAVAAAQSEYSIAGRFGHALEPVIKPLGYDWKMGVGLVAAFAAREVFVSTEGIVYATGGDTDSGTGNLQKAMQTAHRPDGKPVWTPLVAVSLLIWFVLAMQCMSTVAIVKRETGGWGWPIFMTLYMNGLAYVVCLIVFQVGTHLGS